MDSKQLLQIRKRCEAAFRLTPRQRRRLEARQSGFVYVFRAETVKDLLDEIERLRGALEKWVLHHYGLEVDDELAGKSQSGQFCWDTSCSALGIGNEYEDVRAYFKALTPKEPE